MYNWFKNHVLKKPANLKKVKDLLTDKDTMLKQKIEKYEADQKKSKKPKMSGDEILEFVRKYFRSGDKKKLPSSKDFKNIHQWFNRIFKDEAKLKKLKSKLNETDDKNFLAFIAYREARGAKKKKRKLEEEATQASKKMKKI